MRAGRTIGALSQLLGGLGAVVDLFRFQSMTLSALRGEGFILRREIRIARNLRDATRRFRSDYTAISERIEALQPDILRATQDGEAAADVSSDLWGIYFDIADWKQEMAETLSKFDSIIGEAAAKARAARAILESRSASGVLGGLTFGSAVLAELFAAMQDLETIESTVRNARRDLVAAKDLVDIDHDFLFGWYNQLTDICEAAGTCWVWRPFD